MNANGYGFRFFALQSNVVVDKFFREYAAFSQKLVICFQCIERFVKRTRNAADFRFFFSGQIVDVLVERTVAKCTRVDFLSDTVKTGKQHSSERQVRVSCGIRSTEFDTAAFWCYGSYRNTNSRRTVAFGEYQVYRRFIAGDQTLEGVRARVRYSDQSRSMIQDTADVMKSRFAQVGVAPFS